MLFLVKILALMLSIDLYNLVFAGPAAEDGGRQRLFCLGPLFRGDDVGAVVVKSAAPLNSSYIN